MKTLMAHSSKKFRRRLASAPPSQNSCEQPSLLLLVCASAWDQAPARKSKIKKLSTARQNTRTRKYPWSHLPHSRDRPPTSSTGRWQTRSEQKPWNQHRKPREASRQRGITYEPEQHLAISCHVALTCQCMQVRACRSQRHFTTRVALAQQGTSSCPRKNNWSYDELQSSAQLSKRSVGQKCVL